MDTEMLVYLFELTSKRFGECHNLLAQSVVERDYKKATILLNEINQIDRIQSFLEQKYGKPYID